MTDREKEEELYLQANKEVEDGNTSEGTWAKAFANAEGSEEKTKALYIKYRAAKLKVEQENETQQRMLKFKGFYISFLQIT